MLKISCSIQVQVFQVRMTISLTPGGKGFKEWLRKHFCFRKIKNVPIYCECIVDHFKIIFSDRSLCFNFELLYQLITYHALRDLVSFVQFKNCESTPWRSFTFSKIAGLMPATLLKVTLFNGCFSRFLNCSNGSKSCKT